jgi:hypothetical protein
MVVYCLLCIPRPPSLPLPLPLPLHSTFHPSLPPSLHTSLATPFTSCFRSAGSSHIIILNHGLDVAGAGKLACGAKNAKELFKLATLERMLSDRKAAKTQSMFRTRLLARSGGFTAQGTDQDPLLNPEIGRPALRRATAELLLASPEPDFDVAIAITNGISALSYLWTLGAQASGASHAPVPAPPSQRCFPSSSLFDEAHSQCFCLGCIMHPLLGCILHPFLVSMLVPA